MRLPWADGWALWYQTHYLFRQTDLEVAPFLQIEPTNSWLKKAREASFLSRAWIADQMGVTKEGYRKLEQEESRRLDIFHRAAAAMDCDFIYALRPKGGQTFGHRIGDPVLKEVKKYLRQGNAGGIAERMQWQMYDPQFRKRMKWARNSEEEAAFVADLLHNMRTVDRLLYVRVYT